MVTYLRLLATAIRVRARALHVDERGSVTETVIVIAALVVLAITVMALITSKVTHAVDNITIP